MLWSWKNKFFSHCWACTKKRRTLRTLRYKAVVVCYFSSILLTLSITFFHCFPSSCLSSSLPLLRSLVPSILLKLIIIHHVKTKKFTSMKEVWILMILPLGLLFSFCFDWEGISNTWDSVSSAIQSISNFLKNTLLCVIFSTLFSVFGYPDETLFIKFDILHEKQ